MTGHELHATTSRYPDLSVAVVGDFCLDRYLDIDPTLQEISLETGRPVHNVVRVRSQPGAAGTVVNNLSALGVGKIYPVGFYGEDGEGFELLRALDTLPGIHLDHLQRTPERRTFTYTKPLLQEQGRPPRELDRLDLKNQTPTPTPLSHRLAASVDTLIPHVDAIMVMDQVDLVGTGVITPEVQGALQRAAERVPVLADCRRSLKHYPPMIFKMNTAELAVMSGSEITPDGVASQAAALAGKTGYPVFVTMAAQGIVAAGPGVAPVLVPSLPVRGPLDIVGAGDAVSANLVASLAAKATISSAAELAMLAASLVVHQVGTTGTAAVQAMAELLRE